MTTKSSTKKTPQVPGAAPTPTTTASDAAPVSPAGDTGESADSASVGEAAVKADSELPDISEVDPTTLSKPKLTKQGWVCPA